MVDVPATALAPLEGVRVLDLASLYAAPLLSSLLADHGADVVKVEPLGGDVYRDWPGMWSLVGRGKRSLTVDLDTAEGQAIVGRLVGRFDVLVENYPPKVARRRGMTVEQLHAIHPGLVVVSASGFGHDGPLGGAPANGTIGESLAGLTHLTGEPDGAPMLPSVPLGDAIAAAFGAMGALAAVIGAIHHGRGAHVDLTVYEPILHTLGPALPGYDPSDAPPMRDGGDMGAPVRGTFRCLDGRWLSISCSTPRHVAEVAALAGTTPDADVRARALDWFATVPRADALDALGQARVPATAVQDLREVIDHPQVQHRGSIGRIGDTYVAAPTPRIDGRTQVRGTPGLGDANRDLLQGELGLDDHELATLVEAGVVGSSPAGSQGPPAS